MQELDKTAMGSRIREIRLAAGLRQWELAQRLGTTQSAVHKYEHGVVPEPRRLVELARVGETSVEWILTGTHWDSGSTERERLDAALLDLAAGLRRVDTALHEPLAEALRLLEAAAQALPQTDRGSRCAAPVSAGQLRETQGLLEQAWGVHRAVFRQLCSEGRRRLEAARRERQDPAAG